MIEYLFGADWRTMFLPTMPLTEILVHGTVAYLALFLLLRFVLKRELGAMGIADLLLIVLRLMSAVRGHGLASLDQVWEVYIE